MSRATTRAVPIETVPLTASTCTRSLPVRMKRPRVNSGYPSPNARDTSRHTPSITVPAMRRWPAYWVMMSPHTVQSVRPPLSITTTSPSATSSMKSPTVPGGVLALTYLTVNAGPTIGVA